jgi:hypothetical protein
LSLRTAAYLLDGKVVPHHWAAVFSICARDRFGCGDICCANWPRL